MKFQDDELNSLNSVWAIPRELGWGDHIYCVISERLKILDVSVHVLG